MQTHPIVKIYAVHANALENSKLDYKYLRIDHLSKYSIYAEEFLINISFFNIHCEYNDQLTLFSTCFKKLVNPRVLNRWF